MLTGSAAANIIYHADDHVGVGTVTGTITTDGVIGTLGAGDILSFNLTLFDGTGTATLTSGVNGRVAITSNNVTATATQLLFNFNSNGGLLNFFDTSTCSPPEWSFETVGSGVACNGTTGNQMGVSAVLPFGSGTYSNKSGNTVFASTVPEPGSMGLMVAGLASLIGLAKRRF
jgi:hypothetical protein